MVINAYERTKTLRQHRQPTDVVRIGITALCKYKKTLKRNRVGRAGCVCHPRTNAETDTMYSGNRGRNNVRPGQRDCHTKHGTCRADAERSAASLRTCGKGSCRVSYADRNGCPCEVQRARTTDKKKDKHCLSCTVPLIAGMRKILSICRQKNRKISILKSIRWQMHT